MNAPSVEEYFRAHITTGAAGECWAWSGPKDGHGYGRVRLRRLGYSSGAHRVSWELANGAIPDGLYVCHRCDNPSCCNPAHLFLGTHADNMADMSAKGRTFRPHKGACKQGHEFTPENTGRVRGNARRYCRACKNACSRDYHGRVRRFVSHVWIDGRRVWTSPTGPIAAPVADRAQPARLAERAT